jgi:hypothetical protein
MDKTKVKSKSKTIKETTSEVPEVAAGELEKVWETDASVEAAILQESQAEESELPEWIRRMF